MTLSGTLEARQVELQQKSKAERSKQQSRNARNPGKAKLPPRTRVSVKTLLVMIAQDTNVPGKDRVEACKILLALDKKLPVEMIKVDKEPEQAPPAAPVGAGLEPARTY